MPTSIDSQIALTIAINLLMFLKLSNTSHFSFQLGNITATPYLNSLLKAQENVVLLCTLLKRKVHFCIWRFWDFNRKKEGDTIAEERSETFPRYKLAMLQKLWQFCTTTTCNFLCCVWHNFWPQKQSFTGSACHEIFFISKRSQKLNPPPYLLYWKSLLPC